jgi:hypothetical protein
MRYLLAGAAALGVSFMAWAADEATISEHLKRQGAQIDVVGGKTTRVFFQNSGRVGDKELQMIGELADLQKLVVFGKCNALNDKTLALLHPLVKLEELHTDSVQLSDAGLEGLVKFPGLRVATFYHISWGNKAFDGSGFAKLANMKSLRKLTVAGTPFNDKGMEAVGQLQQLEEFRTWHTYQTQAGNEHLAKLTNLKTLYLGQRLRRYDGGSNALSLNDDTLPILARMKGLESLTLDEARFTHAGLLQLKASPRLKKLTLSRCELPQGDLEKVKKDLTPITVEWKPPTEKERETLKRLLDGK